MAVEAERYYAEQLRLKSQRAADAPRELQDLDARIVRLRDRLKGADPDLAPDEIEAALAKAEEKRMQLVKGLPAGKVIYKLLAKLPQALELYRRQIQDPGRARRG